MMEKILCFSKPIQIIINISVNQKRDEAIFSPFWKKYMLFEIEVIRYGCILPCGLLVSLQNHQQLTTRRHLLVRLHQSSIAFGRYINHCQLLSRIFNTKQIMEGHPEIKTIQIQHQSPCILLNSISKTSQPKF